MKSLINQILLFQGKPLDMIPAVNPPKKAQPTARKTAITNEQIIPAKQRKERPPTTL